MASIAITPGAGALLATSTVSRDSATEHIQLVTITDQAGNASLFYPATQPVSGSVTVANGDGSTTPYAIALNFNTAIQIKTGAGKLCRGLVTALGDGVTPLYIYDGNGAIGTIIGIVRPDANIGETLEWYMPCTAGIYVPVQAGNPAVTVSFA